MPIIPLLFVCTWATGFVVARLVAPHSEPLTFLSMRFALAAAVLVLVALVTRATWPTTRRAWIDAAGIGILLQAVYLGGVFWAVKQGLPGGVASLVVSMQPLLTALIAGPLLGETVPTLRRIGIAIGFIGVALVLAPKLGGPSGYPLPALVAVLFSLLTITGATIWQKKARQVDVRVGMIIQYAASFVVMGAAAALTETLHVDSVPEFWIGLLWSVFGLSVGAVFLLLGMIRRGAVVGVAAWMFLVPPVAAAMNHALFGEALLPVQILGMAVAVAGVALATRA